MDSHTRHTLIQRVKDPHNEDAWKIFSDTYKGFIVSVLRKLGIREAEVSDLSQEVIVKLWKQLPNFDYEPKKGKFRTWLYHIVRNTAYSHMKSRGSEQKRIKLYFQDGDEGTEELKVIIHEQWKTFICDKALDNLLEHFNSQSIEIFKKTLEGKAVATLAKEYTLKENTIYRIKNRVKEALIIEISRLRNDLE